jgi:drug/metabolite transporter (DMT)-like permease
MNLADASLLNKTSPFFVMGLAALFLGEKLNRVLIWAIILAFTGALLIIKPTFDVSALPAVAGLGSGFCAGLAYTMIRSLKGKISPNRIVFTFCFISTLLTAPFLLVFPVQPTVGQWLALLGTGLFASGGQYGLTFAYHHARASRISVFTFLHVFFALVVGFAFWGERPDLASILGGFLIVSAAVMTHRNR